MGCHFILFIASVIIAVCCMFMFIAAYRKSVGCFRFFNCFNSMASCLGFIMYILMACSRFSEAGRACSGEFWAEPEQDFSATGGFNWNTFAESCASETGCLFNGEPVAPTWHTGAFTYVLSIIFFVMCGMAVCMMCCMMMCMMMCMGAVMKKMMVMNKD